MCQHLARCFSLKLVRHMKRTCCAGCLDDSARQQRQQLWGGCLSHGCGAGPEPGACFCMSCCQSRKLESKQWQDVGGLRLKDTHQSTSFPACHEHSSCKDVFRR